MKKETPKSLIVAILKSQIKTLDCMQKHYGSPHTNIDNDHKFVFSSPDCLPSYFTKDKKIGDNCISVENYMFGNGFDINQSTSDYRLKKVADRILEEARNKFEMMEYLKLLK